MGKKVIAIFDIGKTNKKLFLFDSTYQEVYREYVQFDETPDEDGYPSDDLVSLQKWMKDVFQQVLQKTEFDITSLNFSGYGASFAHIGQSGETLSPLYNYTKPFDMEVAKAFFESHGPKTGFAQKTGASFLGMLNSGLQLYWLKKKRPKKFREIKMALHLPQFLSYIFTGKGVSEYTSIGCHTALWDFTKQEYHKWVQKEGIAPILPPIVPSSGTTDLVMLGKSIQVGMGIHDSSAALLPYLRASPKPFVLLSTGTWNIAINPFLEENFQLHEVGQSDTLFLTTHGTPVRAKRLFMGKEHEHQVQWLSNVYRVAPDHYKTLKFDEGIYAALIKSFRTRFKWRWLAEHGPNKSTAASIGSFEMAYHQLIIELVMIQKKQLMNVIGESPIKTVYLDGGFSNNVIFRKILAHQLAPLVLYVSNSATGSAVGAAIAISRKELTKDFLEAHYQLQEIVVPFSEPKGQ